MNYFIYLPLVSIPILYFALAFIKPKIQPKIKWNVCALCISVLLTWAILLVLWAFGIDVPRDLIGIMLGMSVIGSLYKIEPVYTKNKIKNFWFVRIVWAVGGLYAVYLLINAKFGAFVLVFIGIVLLIVLATFLFQGVRHADVVEEQKRVGRDESIIKKLDDCC